MLFTFLWMRTTWDTTCRNPKAQQTRRSNTGAQACLALGHSSWRPRLHCSCNWTSFVFCSWADPSAVLLLRSYSQHLSPHHVLERKHACLHRAPLQGISDKAFQLAATSGRYTRVLWLLCFIASHPLPFRLVPGNNWPSSCLSGNPWFLPRWPVLLCDRSINCHLRIVGSVSISHVTYWNVHVLLPCISEASCLQRVGGTTVYSCWQPGCCSNSTCFWEGQMSVWCKAPSVREVRQLP